MTQASTEYFKQTAEDWDAIRAGYFSEGVRQKAIEKAYLRPEMKVADVGAGTGFMAAGLAPLVSQVHVLDGSAEMITVARKNLAAFNNIQYHVSDGQSLDLPDASVDVVFANMYLHHCPDPQAAILEMVRILKPGGRLVITDLDSHPYTWLKEEMADEWMGFERREILAWYQQADLVNVILEGSGQNCQAESQNTEMSCCENKAAKIGIFVATGTRRLVMRDAVREVYGGRVQAANSCGCSGESSTSANTSCGCQGEGQVSAQASGGCCSGENTPAEPAEFYSSAEKAAVPGEAAEFSLGCGNPIAMARLSPGEVVLDIGSGGGMDSFLAASRVGAKGRVIGVDMTPAMLERARASAQKNGIKNVEFRQGQAEALPVEDGSVDVILSNCVINLVEDKGQVFREAFRALKSGGRLEVSDIVTSQAFPLALRANTESWAGCVAGALPEQEYLDLIKQAGFEQVNVRRSDAYSEHGVKVYSAIVSAVKPFRKSCCG